MHTKFNSQSTRIPKSCNHSVNIFSDSELVLPGINLWTWEYSTNLSTSSVVYSEVGRLVNQDDGTTIPFSGTDPDKEVKVKPYNVLPRICISLNKMMETHFD